MSLYRRKVISLMKLTETVSDHGSELLSSFLEAQSWRAVARAFEVGSGEERDRAALELQLLLELAGRGPCETGAAPPRKREKATKSEILEGAKIIIEVEAIILQIVHELNHKESWTENATALESSIKAFQVFETIATMINFIKSNICENPLQMITDITSNMSQMGELAFTAATHPSPPQTSAT
jgi:hypothetical protein